MRGNQQTVQIITESIGPPAARRPRQQQQTQPAGRTGLPEPLQDLPDRRHPGLGIVDREQHRHLAISDPAQRLIERRVPLVPVHGHRFADQPRDPARCFPFGADLPGEPSLALPTRTVHQPHRHLRRLRTPTGQPRPQPLPAIKRDHFPPRLQQRRRRRQPRRNRHRSRKQPRQLHRRHRQPARRPHLVGEPRRSHDHRGRHHRQPAVREPGIIQGHQPDQQTPGEHRRPRHPRPRRLRYRVRRGQRRHPVHDQRIPARP